MPPHWNHSDLLERLRVGRGFQVGKDNYGQIIIYTDLMEVDGELVPWIEGVQDEDGPIKALSNVMQARDTWRQISAPVEEK